jgi:shikimate kinase
VNNRGKSIVLIGMMGAGKSSVGDCLARRTKLTLHDTDEIIASKFRLPIPEIFAKYGEDKFREAETKALREVLQAKQAIIVTGGGIILHEENLQILKRLGVLVWLDGQEQILFERASRSGNRPLLQSENPNPRKAFAQILQARRPLYAKIAHLRVDTSVLTDEEVAVAILSKLGRLNPEPGSPILTTAP